MFILLRALTLLVLVYAAWYLVRTYRTLQQKKSEPPILPDQENSAHDQLVEDSVCHVLLPKQQALRLRQDQRTYYFCSEKCCDQFIKEREKEKK